MIVMISTEENEYMLIHSSAFWGKIFNTIYVEWTKKW